MCNRVILLLLILFELLIQCAESEFIKPSLAMPGRSALASLVRVRLQFYLLPYIFSYSDTCRLKSITSNFNIENPIFVD